MKLLLYPFAALYNLITSLRNWCYDKGILKSVAFDVKTIVVGNLTVGGTGKTPHVEYLIKLLKGDYKLAVLSRGYGRKTKGFLWAPDGATARIIGDEPMQVFRKFGSEVNVAVGEERIIAIPEILNKEENTELVILDDAFQHRALKADYYILLSDYRRIFTRDYLLPMGLLREGRHGAERAKVIIITKCPADLSDAEQHHIREEVRAYAAPGIKIYFTSFSYGQPVQFHGSQSLSNKLILVSGIANPEPLETYLHTSGFDITHHLEFGDHHVYRKGDLGKIKEVYKDGTSIVMTEKDFVKIAELDLQTLLPDFPMFYLPIEVRFLGQEALFQQELRHFLNTEK